MRNEPARLAEISFDVSKISVNRDKFVFTAHVKTLKSSKILYSNVYKTFERTKWLQLLKSQGKGFDGQQT